MICGAFALLVLAARIAAAPQGSPARLGAPLLRDPIWVYNDWSAYDELSDNIPLTEALAQRELDQVLRFRKLGVHFDYYMMDAFWFAPDGAYREWRKPNWPDGPDRWIARCRANGLLPGLWFGSNALVKINPAPAWRDSLNAKGTAMSFSAGGFLPDFMNTLQFWYDHGIRMFEFDFADFTAATPQQEKTDSPQEIEARNETAFRKALQEFRSKNPDIVLVAFNGFGGDLEYTTGHFPFKNSIDLRWLGVFDSLYAGDPRPSDVPETNFWRSMDIYSDHMVRRYEQSFVPLERIDPTSVMFGNTGTIYYRKTHAWKGEVLLMASRGGWVNTIHGNLEFLTDDGVRWFAKVQNIYQPLKAMGRTKTFGGIPGDVEPYGFGSVTTGGAIYTVVNPAQAVEEIKLPLLTRIQPPLAGGRLIFRDAGFVPRLRGNTVTLGPGQMAAVGYGSYAAPEFDLGVQEDVIIPRAIAPLEAKFAPDGSRALVATVTAPARGDLRIIFQQRYPDGTVARSWPGGPPNGTSMGKVLKISAEQDGKMLPVEIDYDRLVWSGLSWGAGEIPHAEFASGRPITIRCSSAEKEQVVLTGRLYTVEY
ncbi:MAG TPA: hypothetical protein VL523_17100 [Terriglobia bacterium]|nr:hypothetical protein [Terriglobia bacterium]